MTRAELLNMARRTLAHARAGTIPQVETVARVPVEHYIDHQRWSLEMARVFKRLPLVLGFSCELSGPNDYKATDVVGVPVLLTRGTDGAVRAFVNMCSHRGAIVVAEGSGTARRFSCPYHGWTYDRDGSLVGVLDRSDFGDLDPACHGLTPLPVAERSGIIYGIVSHDTGVDLENDIETYLCGYHGMLDHLGLAACHHVGSQSVTGPNWKLAYDGYLDFYHLPILHKDSFGPGVSNKAVYDAWGPHQRVSSPDRMHLRLDGIPEHQWPHEVLTSGVWTIFPHASIAAFKVADPDDRLGRSGSGGGSMYMISTLFPGPEPGTSVTTQHFLAAFDPGPDIMASIEAQQRFLLRVVRDEDYFTGARIQRAAATGAKASFLFGRNEAGGQRFHRWVDEIVATDSQDELLKLFARAGADHQP